MDNMIWKIFEWCDVHYRQPVDNVLDVVSYALSRYGYHPDRDYWRDQLHNTDDAKLMSMDMTYSDFFDVMSAELNTQTEIKKVIGRGISKLFRSQVFTSPDLYRIDDNLLLRLFLDEINERKRIKTSYNTMTCSDYLWYITFEGRLGRVKWGGAKCNAEKLLKKRLIVKDRFGIYRATKVLNRCGCENVRHRPIIKSLSRGRWSKFITDKLIDLLDGGHEMDYVIDREFQKAYDPTYDENITIEDLVTSQSCMSDRGDDAETFYGSIDGCYVMRFLKDGEDVGRCIMYEYNGIRHFIRIYCQPEYQRDCLYTLRKQMNDNDLFGRCEKIPDLELRCHFDEDTRNMYLDGNRYGFTVRDGHIYMVSNNTMYDGESTYEGRFCNVIDDYGVHLCANCGDWVSSRYGIKNDYDDEWYCCEECAEECGWVRCAYCGDYHRECITTTDGFHYCCEDCADNDGYVCCIDTDEWIYKEDAFEVEENRFYTSEDAARKDGWDKCVECGQWAKMCHSCQDGKTRCTACLLDGWELQYVKIKDNQDDKDETSGD